jgi:glycosyltransferase involved in cell wall biosynthesis
MPPNSSRSGSVLVVGKAAPERGGIPSFLDMINSSPVLRPYQPTLLNLTRAGAREGGRISGGNLARTAQDARLVWRHARRGQVVHIHSALSPLVTLVRAGALSLAARLRGGRVLLHAHGGLVQLWLTSPWRRAIARAALAPVGRVVAVSEGGCTALRAALGERRVVLVDNGVDVARFTPGPPRNPAGPPRILYVGLLTPRKGVVDLLQTSRLLAARGVQHELVLVGGAPDEGGTAEAEVRAAATDTVHFAGVRDVADMPATYRGADVFCLPSWWEAMPLSVLEAMATGLPVVATDVGDVARAVVDGETGRVVPAKDPEQLADALEEVLRSPDRRAAMGAAGRARVVAQFSVTSTAEALAALYDELAAPRR